MQQRIRVAFDAMGGDFAPQETVKGAVEAARGGKVEVLVVGQPDAVQAELAKYDTAGLPLKLIPSEGAVSEREHPALALRRTPKASIAVTISLVKQGAADAAVSMGSTGATMAASTLLLGTLGGLDRPALGGPFLGLAPKVTFLDLGSNVDCRPSQLLAFAVLGASFSRFFLGIENPRVALLSVGSEEEKGNKQVREAFPVFKESGLNFVGNVEGYDFFTNRADVIVCDGFVGNVLMKFSEGMGAAVVGYLKKMLAAKAPGLLDGVGSQLVDLTSPAKKHGGPLFGINGAVVVGHGASHSGEVAGAIGLAQHMVETKLVDQMRNELTKFSDVIQRSAKVAGDASAPRA